MRQWRNSVINMTTLNPRIFIPAVILYMILLWAIMARAQEIDLNKIITIESAGNPRAYNRYSNARGLCQITPVCLKDYNLFHKVKYSSNDLFTLAINKVIASWYLEIRIPQLLRHYGKEVNTRNILVSYNAGISYVVRNKPLPKETRGYIKKYNRLEG